MTTPHTMKHYIFNFHLYSLSQSYHFFVQFKRHRALNY